MAQGQLTVDLEAVVANWRAMDRLSAASVATGAVLKADAYGLGLAPVARALASAGARQFFVVQAEEGAALRTALGAGPDIYILAGHMAGDAGLIAAHGLIPVLSASAQVARHLGALPGHPFGLQLETGMYRLGIDAADWAAMAGDLVARGPALIMSHLASADDPASGQNAAQLAAFRRMTDGIAVPRSLAATGGTVLGPDYHFDLTRPGIGLYGGLPFADARPVVRLSLPVAQLRGIPAGAPVGYSATWTAPRPTRLATVLSGYADGLIRSLSGKAVLWHGDRPCPLVGRVSMDLLTVDVTGLDGDPDHLDILCPAQTIDALADLAGTISYEILTSLGARYQRHYLGAGA